MKKPIVFDGEKAKKIGVLGALIVQKIDEGYDSLSKLKEALYFVKVDEITNKVKELTENKVIFNNGILLSNEELREKNIIKKNHYSEEFEEIWKLYNEGKTNKGSKKLAYERYLKSPLSLLPLFAQKHIIEEYKGSVSDTKYMKHMSTFISEQIYEEYLPEECYFTTNKGTLPGLIMGEKLYYLKQNGTYGIYNLGNKKEQYIKEGIIVLK